MKATLEAFLQSLQKLSREQLIQKLVQMKENEMNQSVVLTEMRNTSTAMTRDYSKIQESNRETPGRKHPAEERQQTALRGERTAVAKSLRTAVRKGHLYG